MKQYISESVFAGRIVNFGKVTDLSADFTLSGRPFSVLIVPKGGTESQTHVTMPVKAWASDAFASFPFPEGDWSPLLIKAVEASGLDLTAYDLYWGTGEWYNE